MSVLDVLGMLPWRTGAPFSRGMYAVSTKEGGDIFLGVLLNASVAEYVCEQHNQGLTPRTPV